MTSPEHRGLGTRIRRVAVSTARAGVQAGVHGGLCAGLWPRARAFAQACDDVNAAQTSVLHHLQKHWQGTALARRHPSLLRLRHPCELADVVDVGGYESHQADFEAMAAGATHCRTNAKVVRFERSGGSTGAQKLLPQTTSFLAEMQRGIGPWLHDLYRRRRGLWQTAAYWSISPLAQGPGLTTSGGIAIGADDDSTYLPGPLALALRAVMVAHPALAHFPDIESCRYATVRLLLARADLGLISVWSPTFLTLLLGVLDHHAERLVEDIARGTCRVPLSGSATTARDHLVEAASASLPLTADRHRAKALRRILAGDGVLTPTKVWPRLQLISLWQDGESARFVDDVCRRFPGVPLQGKGLLATEGIISIPLDGAPAPVLTVNSHLYEFRFDDGRVCLPHQLREGDEAEVILSTSAGLLRYGLGDRVRVEGFHYQAPCLRFLGRGAQVVDLVGEKLSGAYVAQSLTHLMSSSSSSSSSSSLSEDLSHRPRSPTAAPFSLLVPWRGSEPHYRLYLDGMSADDATHLARRLDDLLSEGHPYRYARELGQLGAVEPVVVAGAQGRYEAACVARGQRVGDIKALALSGDDAWHEVFGANGPSPSSSASSNASSNTSSPSRSQAPGRPPEMSP